MRTILTFLFSLFFFYCFGQTNYKELSGTVKKSATINIHDVQDDFTPVLINLEAPHPGSSREILARIKEKAEEYFADKKADVYSDRSSSLPDPLVLRNRIGNPPAGVPNDNDVAISNDGKLITVINSVFQIIDVEEDKVLKAATLNTFSNALGITGSKFDPKIIYDPLKDRFVMIFLNGFTDTTSYIILGFSNTTDPMGDWNFYGLWGNPIDNNTWSDYPVVGISSHELFIGINTFTNGSSNNSGFVETCFWQIGLNEGYKGNELKTNYYYNILQNTQPIFNITPIKGGSSSYGPNMYLLSNRNLAIENDTIFLLEVTDTIDSPNRQLKITTLISPVKYAIPPSARQADDHTFDTNDSRILGGFFENNKIQFVQSCRHQPTGFAGIYHGIINNVTTGNTSVSANILGNDILDYGFPNISYTGNSSSQDDAIITFNHTAPTVFAGMSAIQTDGKGQYSNSVTIKNGDNYVNAMQGYYERWGDYSGSQRKYNEPGKVWATGYFGNSQRRNGTWIAEVAIPAIASTSELKSELKTNVFPNPSNHLVNVQFETEKESFLTFTIADFSGKTVAHLMSERTKKGLNQFSFSVEKLEKGIYFLMISEGNILILNKKIIRN
jgi:hypothetical protein